MMELSIVIALLLALTTILFIGARAWKTGADRAGCILNIRNVQTSVRSYQNMYAFSPGGMPYAEGGTRDIAVHLHKKGYITDGQLAEMTGEGTCPGGGHYERENPDAFPRVGVLYINCSLETSDEHVPAEGLEW